MFFCFKHLHSLVPQRYNFTTEKSINFCDAGESVDACPVSEKFGDCFWLCCKSSFKYEAHPMPGTRTEISSPLLSRHCREPFWQRGRQWPDSLFAQRSFYVFILI